VFLELVCFDCISKGANCVFYMIDLAGELKDALAAKPIFLGFALTHEFIEGLDLYLKYTRNMFRDLCDFSVKETKETSL
jgi:hypothetical protein